MALYIDPEDDTEAYDHVIFAKDMRTPGRCKVEGFSRDCEYDHKKGKGVKGSTSTLKGLPPAKGKITWWTWTAAQRRDFNRFVELFKFDPSKLNKGGTGTAATKPTDPTSQYTSREGGAGSGPGSSSGTIPEPGSTGAKKDASAKEDKADNTPALGKDSAIEVFYPTLADVGIHYFLPPEKLGIWEPDGDDFTYMKREIEFFEFIDPDDKSIAATATGAAANPDSAASAGGQGGTDPEGGAGSAGKEAQGAAGEP